MRIPAWVLVAGIALAACRPNDKQCPAGQVRQGNECVTQNQCAAGTLACGVSCCDAGQSCVDGRCRGAACDPTHPCKVGEVCRDGYCLGSDPSCVYEPPRDGGGFTPRVAWRWEGSNTQPQYDHVLMTPVVMPLHPGSGDLFEPPAVVFNAIRGDMGAGEEVPAVMRAVRGDGSGEIWTTDPSHPVNGLAGIAAGDLLGTGEPVFVTARYGSFVPAERGVIAFGADGRFLWEVKGIELKWGAPSIANLFGGKEASVVVGATIIDAHGRVVCSGAYGVGSNFSGPISVVADVDLDGVPEIVTGNTVYGTDCKPRPGWPAYQDAAHQYLWGDGLTAVADFTGDDHPEIVVVSGGPKVNGVSQGTVRVHDWRGNLVWGPVPLPGGGAGGAPTVADFDGDGQPEIGVASRSRYSVLKPFAANPVLWSRPTQDHSDVTGSSVFDFENDGKAEVVYADECYTRVYDGRSGSTLFEAPSSSCTTHENPVVADVDADGRAEIVVPENSVCNYACPWGDQYGSGHHGIIVMKDLRDRWVSTRPVWNQHAYHVTNVDDDGGIPTHEQPHWKLEGLNAFRMNPMGRRDYAAPNATLEPSDVSLDRSGCPSRLRVKVRVWNRGAVPIAAGLPVSVRALPTQAVLATGATGGAILPGRSEEITVDVSNPPPEASGIEVRVDDDGAGAGVAAECREDDNVADVPGTLCIVGPG